MLHACRQELVCHSCPEVAWHAMMPGNDESVCAKYVRSHLLPVYAGGIDVSEDGVKSKEVKESRASAG